MIDIFDSSVRSKGDLAGVFECDEETGYFYFFDQTLSEGDKIIAALQICKGRPAFEQKDIIVDWNASETIVGLTIRGKLWAAFDESGRSYSGGLCDPNREPDIAPDIKAAFLEEENSD